MAFRRLPSPCYWSFLAQFCRSTGVDAPWMHSRYSLWLPPPAAGAADARQFGAGRAAELFEQAAQAGAALRALRAVRSG